MSLVTEILQALWIKEGNTMRISATEIITPLHLPGLTSCHGMTYEYQNQVGGTKDEIRISIQISSKAFMLNKANKVQGGQKESFTQSLCFTVNYSLIFLIDHWFN